MSTKAIADAIETAVHDTRADGPLSPYQSRIVLDHILVTASRKRGRQWRRIERLLEIGMQGST